MKYTYRVRADRIQDEEQEQRTVYGIEVLSEKGEVLSEYTLQDLFCESDRAQELVTLCNRLELDPVHLFAVAEDALV